MAFDLLPVSAVLSDRVASLLSAFYEGLNQNTLRCYRASLADFSAFLGPDAPRTLLEAGHGEANRIVLAYRADMVRRDLAAATINNRLAAVRSLVKLARTLGIVNWALDIKGVKAAAYRDTSGCGTDGFKKLLAIARKRTDAKGLRDFAILRLLYDLALRRAEVCSLDLADFDGSRLLVLGKGRTEKVPLTLPNPTVMALTAWLAVRGNDPGPLFVSFDQAAKGSGRITGCSIARIVADLGAAAGVAAHPHGLRHASITAALDATGGNVRAVQKFSRHTKLDTLLVYDDARQDIAGKVAQIVAVPL
jgi:integrase/recombinase XerC